MVGRDRNGLALATQHCPFTGGVSKSERALVAGTDGSVAQVEEKITQAVKTFGLAPGAQKMMDAERLAAEEAMRTGLYGVWRNEASGQDFCGRIGPQSRCFCGHEYSEHVWDKGKKKLRPKCGSCQCSGFRYMPRRPEEVGEWWLPRRRGFDVRVWRAKCKCSHSHEDHDPNRLSCRECGCHAFQSAWLCTCCEGKWEDHESLWETEQERAMLGRPIGQAFFPLNSTPQIQDIAFNKSVGDGPRSHSLPHRTRPERSVRLMQERCPHYGGIGAAAPNGRSSSSSGFGSLEDAFPARRQSPMGSLEDAFPPRRQTQSPMGSLQDAFPPARNGASGGSSTQSARNWGEASSSGRESPFGAAPGRQAAARSAVARGGPTGRAIADVAAAGPARGAGGPAGGAPRMSGRPPSGGQR